ncbi:MAG: hypothetical protein ACFCBW_18275 [Candidatus Competibacterales bacterium]
MDRGYYLKLNAATLGKPYVQAFVQGVSSHRADLAWGISRGRAASPRGLEGRRPTG